MSRSTGNTGDRPGADDGGTGGGHAARAAVNSDQAVRFGQPAGRWVLLGAVLGSAVVGLDATVVNVALRVIGDDLGANLSGLQWVLNGYTLALAALILLGGSLGDRYGRRRIFVIGVVWFALASLLCGLAPNVTALIAARVLQGVGGALLTPGSLAIIQASFAPEDRAKAIGAWSGLGGVATAIGPFLGGYLIDVVSWRLIFLINLPVAAFVVYVALRHIPESSDPTMHDRKIDGVGAVLGALGLAGITFALIQGGEQGVTATVAAAAVIGVLACVGFVVAERRGDHPMLPLDIFRSRQFTAANIVTLPVYAAISGVFFLLVVHVQVVLGYSALESGAFALPITILMLALSARAGALAGRIGPRLPMTLGPLLMAAGLFLMREIGPGDTYLLGVLPGVVLFGLGLSLTVAPLTATVLAAADDRHSGIASGVNNAVARAAGLLAVAVLPALAGLSGNDYQDAQAFPPGFRTAALIAAVLTALGGVIAWFTISNDVLTASGEPIGHAHAGIDAPPLRGRAGGAHAAGS